MASSLSSSCFLWFFRSDITSLLFSSHSSQQLFRIVLALALFFTLFTSIAIWAFFDLSFFLISGSQAIGVVIIFLKRISVGLLSSSASLAMLIVTFSSDSCKVGISELTDAILSVKQRAILSFFQEQCYTSFRYKEISLVRFCLFLNFLKDSSAPNISQMNSSFSMLLLSSRLVGEGDPQAVPSFFFMLMYKTILSFYIIHHHSHDNTIKTAKTYAGKQTNHFEWGLVG